jgi:WD40 repeat protein
MIETAFADIIKNIVSERGKDVFLEPRKLKSILLDYTKNEYKKETTLLSAILEADSVKYIKMAENLAECKQFLVKRLDDDYSLSPQKSMEMLDLLFSVLRDEKEQQSITKDSSFQLLQNSGKEDKSFNKFHLLFSLKEPEDYISIFKYSPDSKYIVTGSANRTLSLWDAVNGRLIYTLEGHYEEISSISFSPDGKYIVSGSNDYTVKLWDTKNGQLIHTFEGHDDVIHSVAFSPDSSYIASSSSDHTIKLWNTKNGLLINTLEGHEDEIHSVSFSPDGKFIVSGSIDSTLKLWDAESGRLIWSEFGGEMFSFSPDGKYIASWSEYYVRNDWWKLYDFKTGKLINTSENHKSHINSLAFSPDGKYIITGANDGICIWDSKSGLFLFTTSDVIKDQVNSITFSPYENYLVTGSDDGTLKLWVIENNKFIFKALEMHDMMHNSCISSVAFSPDGRYVTSISFLYPCDLKVWWLECSNNSSTIKPALKIASTSNKYVTEKIDNKIIFYMNHLIDSKTMSLLNYLYKLTKNLPNDLFSVFTDSEEYETLCQLINYNKDSIKIKKSEVKEMFNCIDLLLEELPEKQIEEFVNSEYWDIYKETLKSFGIF